MNNITAFSGLDDEEDLEALRLAALQSLKKNAPLPDGNTLQIYPQQSPEHHSQFWQNKGFRNKKGKAFGLQYSSRGNRTGHFNRVRSTNLISIPTLPADTEADDKPNSNEVKLNLPQNRYCVNDDGDKSQDSSSKFDRYNNSDKSESESEDETDILLSDEEGPPLKKSNSLEALMQELDKEIEGKVAEEKTKTKKTKKRKKETSTSDTANEGVENAVDEPDKPKNTNDSASIVTEDPKEPVSSVEGETQQVQNEFGSPMKKRLRTGSPNRRNFYNRRRQRNYPMQQQNPSVMMPYGPGPVQYPPQMLPFNGQPFNPMYGPPGMMPNQPIPPYFDNSLPPLTINTEPLPGPTLAPLSPRSAAFVMENKAIIERRRRSPRRSYSRSPSRSPARSLTPRRSPRWSISPRRSPVRRLPPRKRSLTPKRKSISPRRNPLTPRRKSVSPRRLSSPRRKSLSPKRKSLSPKRKSLSPRRRSVSPRRRSLTPRRQSPLPRSPNRKKSVSPKRKAGDGVSSRAPVRDRLGVKTKTEEKEKPKQTEEPAKKDDKPLDPILEARKRKFESNEIKMKEGIIRLRPKDEKPKDDPPKEEKPIEIKQKETKPNSNKTKDERPKVDKPKEEPVKQEKPKPQIDETVGIKIEKTVTEPRSTTPKPKESIVEVAPATTTTEDKQIDVPDEFKELEKLLLGGDDLELVPKVEDIFSDEDSASDNEGRFKVKEQKTSAKPPVISFSKLVNGEKREIKSEPLAKYTKNKDGRERSDRDRLSHRSRTNVNERRERKESPTIVSEKEKKKSPEKSFAKSLAKHRATFRTERPPPVMDKRFERKIEIKIKNPSKYERSGKSKIVSKNEIASSSSSSTIDRKISVEERTSDSTVEEDDEETEPEMIVDNGSDDEYSNFNEGDLRAQLSKKRAEKLHKIPEQVSKRILDYALKGALYKKSKKKSKDKDIIICDGKPPIHLRLGMGQELYPEPRVKRKSRKRKNREILEQLEYHVIEK